MKSKIVLDRTGVKRTITIDDVDFDLAEAYDWKVDMTSAEIALFEEKKRAGANAGHSPKVFVFEEGKKQLHQLIFSRFCDETGYVTKKHEKLVFRGSWSDLTRNNILIRATGHTLAEQAEIMGTVKVIEEPEPNSPNPLQVKVVEHYACRIAIAYDNDDYDECARLTEEAEAIHPDLIYTLLKTNITW